MRTIVWILLASCWASAQASMHGLSFHDTLIVHDKQLGEKTLLMRVTHSEDVCFWERESGYPVYWSAQDSLLYYAEQGEIQGYSGALVPSSVPFSEDPPAGCRPWMESGGAWRAALEDCQNREHLVEQQGIVKLCYVGISASSFVNWINGEMLPATNALTFIESEFVEDNVDAETVNEPPDFNYPTTKRLFEDSGAAGGNGGISLQPDDTRWYQYNPEHPGWVSTSWTNDTLPDPIQLPFELYSGMYDIETEMVWDSTMCRLHEMGVDTSTQSHNYFVLVWAHPSYLLGVPHRMPRALVDRGMILPLDYLGGYLPTGHVTRMVLGTLGVPEQSEENTNMPRANLLCQGFLGGDGQSVWRPAWIDPLTETLLGWLPTTDLSVNQDELVRDNQRRVYRHQRCAAGEYVYVDIYNWQQSLSCGMRDTTCLRVCELDYSSTGDLSQHVYMTPAQGDNTAWGCWPSPLADSLVVDLGGTGSLHKELRLWEMSPARYSSSDSASVHIHWDSNPVPLNFHLAALEEDGRLHLDIESYSWADYAFSQLHVSLDGSSTSYDLPPMLQEGFPSIDLGQELLLHSLHNLEISVSAHGDDFVLLSSSEYPVTQQRLQQLPFRPKGVIATSEDALLGQTDSRSFYYKERELQREWNWGYEDCEFTLAGLVPENPNLLFFWTYSQISPNGPEIYHVGDPSAVFSLPNTADRIKPMMAMNNHVLYHFDQLNCLSWDGQSFTSDNLFDGGQLYCVTREPELPRICVTSQYSVWVLTPLGQIVHEETIAGHGSLGQPRAMDCDGDGAREFVIPTQNGLLTLDAEQPDEYSSTYFDTASEPLCLATWHEDGCAIPLLLCEEGLYFHQQLFDLDCLPVKFERFQAISSNGGSDDDMLLGVCESGLYTMTRDTDGEIQAGPCIARVSCLGTDPVMTIWDDQPLLLVQQRDGNWLEYAMPQNCSWQYTGQRGNPGADFCDAFLAGVEAPPQPLVHTEIRRHDGLTELLFEVNEDQHVLNGFKIYRSMDPYVFSAEALVELGPCVRSWVDPESPEGAYYRTTIRYDEPYGFICPDRSDN